MSPANRRSAFAILALALGGLPSARPSSSRWVCCRRSPTAPGRQRDGGALRLGLRAGGGRRGSAQPPSWRSVPRKPGCRGPMASPPWRTSRSRSATVDPTSGRRLLGPDPTGYFGIGSLAASLVSHQPPHRRGRDPARCGSASPTSSGCPSRRSSASATRGTCPISSSASSASSHRRGDRRYFLPHQSPSGDESMRSEIAGTAPAAGVAGAAHRCRRLPAACSRCTPTSRRR